MGSIKKLIGLALVGLVGVVALAPAAGAVEANVSPLSCTFDVNPKVTTFPTVVTVSGTAPEGSTVKVFVNGAEVPGKSKVIGIDFGFSFQVDLAAASDVSVNYYTIAGNAYATGCADVEGTVVIRVRAAAAALAFTGSSSNTSTYVLAGLAAIVVGLVLVVGVRRRASVRG